MLFRDIADLITITTTQNAVGDDIQSKSYSQRYVNKKSVRQTEFYQAAQTGRKPEIMFNIRNIDYNGENMIRYNSIEYTVIRTYSVDDEILELICGGLVNNGNA